MATSSSDASEAASLPGGALEAYLERLTRPVSTLGVVGMLVGAGATVVDIVLRFSVSSGVAGLNELIAMSFAVAVAACFPAGVARGVGIRVDLLEPHMTRRVAATMQALGAILFCVFLGLLSYRIAEYAATLQAQGRTSVILSLPLAPFIWGTATLIAFSALVQAAIAAKAVLVAVATSAGEPLNAVSVCALAFGALLLVLTGVLIVDFDGAANVAFDRPITTIVAIFALMWLALLFLVPLAAVMGLLGVFGCALFIGFGPSLSAAATEAVGFMTSYQTASLPLFLLMGGFAAASGISDDLYRLAQAVLGRFRGGLAMATIGGCAGFGAVTGSSLATVVTFGRVALPQMDERRYSPGLAAGCVAAGGTLGALIPPSSPIIIFALLTESSIGQLFVAAIVPGLLATALYLVAINVTLRFRPQLAPKAEPTSGREILDALQNCGAVVALFGVVIGGLYGGVFTATEAAAVGAFTAFALAIVRGRLRRDTFWSVMVETTLSTAMIYLLILGVLAFSFCVGVSGLPETLGAYVGGLELPPLAIIAVILLLYLLLGSVMDSFSVMIITIPIITPVVLLLGYDIVWWGILNLAVVEIGLITPPFGLHLFVLKSLMPKVSLKQLYVGVAPFCVADFVRLALLILFPVLVLWLPSKMI